MTIDRKIKVAVIGAGASGLTAIKECLDEKDRIDVVCFEQENQLGGLWRYVEVTKENPNPHSSVYKSTIINTCKQMMSFSDYAIPGDWPVFLPNKKIAEYFDMYADHFDLLPHIRFQTKVIEVKELHDAENQWLVRYHQVTPLGAAPASTPEIKEEIFDYIMMCSGHHWKPRYPSFPGMNPEDPEGFTGQQLHSHYYRSVEDFKDKKAVIVGLGNSASDLAVELSLNQTQVYLSSRRPAYIFPRWSLGVPTDTVRTRFSHSLPLFLVQAGTSALLKLTTPPPHENMVPFNKPFESHPTINSILPERITTGTVKPMKNIKKLGPGKKVEFEDGAVVDDVDVIFYCTGYHVSFPVLHPDIVTDGKEGSEDNRVWTWNYMIPPRHPNLAFVGLFQPLGAIMPISEMQTRFLVQTLVGKLDPLPSAKEMDKEIQERQDDISKRYYDAPRHTIQVDYATYCDQLAKRIGCFPTLSKLVKKFGLLEGIRLKNETFFGAATPIHYRLVGPNAWEGARETTWGYAGKKEHVNSKYLQDTGSLMKDSKGASKAKVL